MNADKGDSCPATSEESHFSTVISDIANGNYIDANVQRLTHQTETKYFSEEDRLITFRTWNGNQNVIQKLAKAGFYYIEAEFKVKCPYCSYERKIWTIADDPDSGHREGSPKCVYMLWAKPTSDYYNLTSHVNESYDTCGFYGVEGVNAVTLEIDKLSKIGNKPPYYNSTGVTVHPDYMQYIDRFKTFSKWPKISRISPDALSEAGFLFTQIDDRTSCFHCGGSLHDWDESADPWFEHVRWFPHCQFLKLMKGQRFLDECQARQNSISSVKKSSPFIIDAVQNEDVDGGCLSRSRARSPIISKTCTDENRNPFLQCKICRANERNAVLFPCRHVVICIHCANRMTECHHCKKQITHRLRIYPVP